MILQDLEVNYHGPVTEAIKIGNWYADAKNLDLYPDRRRPAENKDAALIKSLSTAELKKFAARTDLPPDMLQLAQAELASRPVKTKPAAPVAPATPPVNYNIPAYQRRGLPAPVLTPVTPATPTPPVNYNIPAYLRRQPAAPAATAPAVAPTVPAAPAPVATKTRTGGRVAGQLSQTPRAIKRRQATAAKRAAATAPAVTAPAAGAGGKVGTYTGRQPVGPVRAGAPTAAEQAKLQQRIQAALQRQAMAESLTWSKDFDPSVSLLRQIGHH